MNAGTQEFSRLLGAYQALALLSADEVRETEALCTAGHALTTAIVVAESIHLHVRVPDTAKLPRAEILALGAVAQSEQPGYVKFAHPQGLNMIFSSIDIAEEDLIREAPAPARPCVDHFGLDLRSLDPAVVAIFDGVPAIARQLGWAHVAQGGSGQPVYCCHTEVSGKHWVYPRANAVTRPIEVASGPLQIHGAKAGCDLRPIDPAHPLAKRATPCCGASPESKVVAFRTK